MAEEITQETAYSLSFSSFIFNDIYNIKKFRSTLKAFL